MGHILKRQNLKILNRHKDENFLKFLWLQAKILNIDSIIQIRTFGLRTIRVFLSGFPLHYLTFTNIFAWWGLSSWSPHIYYAGNHGRSQDFFSGGGNTFSKNFSKNSQKIFKKIFKNIQKIWKNIQKNFLKKFATNTLF